MIKKKFRLREKEVKRVLQKWKPFFSYNIVLNKQKNKLWFNRFAIVISAKSIETNVERNFFRRRFYDFIQNSKISEEQSQDFVFVIKTKSRFCKKQTQSLNLFYKDLQFLISKI